MKTENDSVVDGKINLTDEQIGRLQRKFNEIIRRIKQGTIDYDETVKALQNIVIEGKAPLHLGVVKGNYEIRAIEHLIDCDANPFIPEGQSVEEHKKGGFFKFDLAKISLYLSKEQKEGGIEGNDLRKELENQPVLNANVLDYLLAHPYLIPEEWKDKTIFFWGTIYRRPEGYLDVRCLRWDGSEWIWRYGWLDLNFRSEHFTACAN